jgi:hypothetical protein
VPGGFVHPPTFTLLDLYVPSGFLPRRLYWYLICGYDWSSSPLWFLSSVRLMRNLPRKQRSSISASNCRRFCHSASSAGELSRYPARRRFPSAQLSCCPLSSWYHKHFSESHHYYWSAFDAHWPLKVRKKNTTTANAKATPHRLKVFGDSMGMRLGDVEDFEFGLQHERRSRPSSDMPEHTAGPVHRSSFLLLLPLRLPWWLLEHCWLIDWRLVGWLVGLCCRRVDLCP